MHSWPSLPVKVRQYERLCGLLPGTIFRRPNSNYILEFEQLWFDNHIGVVANCGPGRYIALDYSNVSDVFAGIRIELMVRDFDLVRTKTVLRYRLLRFAESSCSSAIGMQPRCTFLR